MFEVLLGVAAFFGLWGGLIYLGRRYRQSWTIAAGGGFIASLLVASGVFAVVLKTVGGRAAPRSDFTLEVSYQASGLSNEQAYKTMASFVQACPGFGRVAAELTDIKITGPSSPHSEDRLRGWTQKYQLTFKVPGRPKSQELIDAFAMGHTCFYDLGGGHLPGIHPYKSPCARICEMQEYAHTSVGEMKLLDDPASDDYRKRRAALEKELQDYLAEYEPAAMRNDYQAQRNLAYVLSRESFRREDRVTGCAWRAYISNSQIKADSGDLDNLKTECSKLTEQEREAAIVKAKAILSSVKKK